MGVTIGEVQAVMTARDTMTPVMAAAVARITELEYKLGTLGATSQEQFNLWNRQLLSAQANLEKLQQAGNAGAGGLEEVSKKASAGTQNLAQMEGMALRLAERMVLLYAIRATASFVTDLFESAAALDKLSKSSDFTTTRLQELQYAADATGVPFNKVTGAADTLTKKMAEMKLSTEDALESIGLSFSKVLNLKPEERFDLVAAAIGKIQDPVKRAKAEIELLGSDALDPVIRQMAQLAKEAHDNNQIIGPETVQALAISDKAWHDFFASVRTDASGVLIYMQNWVAGMIIASDPYGQNAKNKQDRPTGPQGHDVLLMDPSTQNSGSNAPVQGPSEDYIDRLVKAAHGVNALTAEQTRQLDILAKNNLLTKENAAALDFQNKSLDIDTPKFELYVQQHKELEAAMKKAATQTAQYAAAWDDLNTAGEGWRGTLDGVNDDTIKTIQYYLDAGASIDKLAKAYPNLSEIQIKAIKAKNDEEKKAAAEFAKLDEKVQQDSEQGWALYYDTVAKYGGDTVAKQMANQDKWLADQVAKHVKAKTDTADFYEWVYAVDGQARDNINHNNELKDKNSKAYLQQQKDDAVAHYHFMLENATNYTVLDIELARKDAEAKTKILGEFDRYSTKLLQGQQQQVLGLMDQVSMAMASISGDMNSTVKSVRTLSGELITAAQAKAIFDSGGSSQLADFSKSDFDAAGGVNRLNQIKQGYLINPGRAVGQNGNTGILSNDDAGWRAMLAEQVQYAELMNYAKKNNIPGFASGVTNFSGGLAMVGERGPELVNLPSGSNVYPNGSGGGPSIVNHFYITDTESNIVNRVMQVLTTQVLRNAKVSVAN